MRESPSKVAAYQFQKYGMLDAIVSQVSADAADDSSAAMRSQSPAPDKGTMALIYRTQIDLGQPYLEARGQRHTLTPGMQVAAEIKLGRRSVLEYILSPVTGVFREAGRER